MKGTKTILIGLLVFIASIGYATKAEAKEAGYKGVAWGATKQALQSKIGGMRTVKKFDWDDGMGGFIFNSWQFSGAFLQMLGVKENNIGQFEENYIPTFTLLEKGGTPNPYAEESTLSKGSDTAVFYKGKFFAYSFSVKTENVSESKAALVSKYGISNETKHHEVVGQGLELISNVDCEIWHSGDTTIMLGREHSQGKDDHRFTDPDSTRIIYYSQKMFVELSGDVAEKIKKAENKAAEAARRDEEKKAGEQKQEHEENLNKIQ